ncbi:transketolase family protein [Synechococcus sp. UW105]|uniref:transketolase family protein n=1 Tax=Synechococcus sp. UW105 TaxID=337067 RepID=UPI000E0F6DC8|nr:transketolase [Synechococcus sp. UW105]
MRSAFIKWLVNKSQADKRIHLLTGDLGYSVVESFQSVFPDRFINVGVAEQNMTGIAAGLTSEKLLAYTYSIGIFPTFRCAEQIRNDIDYHNLPVVTCTVGSGVAYGSLGYSHHAIQDISLMRALPNMVIATPCDPAQVIDILEWHYNNPCPMYLRLHKSGEGSLRRENCSLGLGLIQQIYPTPGDFSHSFSRDICVLVVGFTAEKVSIIVNNHAPHIPIFSVPLWGCSAKNNFIDELNEFKTIITVEDHVLEGGFGAYVMESLATARLNKTVIPITLESDVVGKVAKEEILLAPLFRQLQQTLLSLVQG